MIRLIATIEGEGFSCPIHEDADGRVYFTADADIDADGANGQNGAKPAYTARNDGSELLANGGMGIVKGGFAGARVIGIRDWFRDIVILNENGEPKLFPGGVVASKTAYRFGDKFSDDPSAYVDSETVPYIVIPPVIIARTEGVVLGCKCIVTNNLTGEKVEGMVVDVGPRTRVGEVSIEMARRLGIDPSPRDGGEEHPVITYELWPGVRSQYGYPLLRSDGRYV